MHACGGWARQARGQHRWISQAKKGDTRRRRLRPEAKAPSSAATCASPSSSSSAPPSHKAPHHHRHHHHHRRLRANRSRSIESLDYQRERGVARRGRRGVVYVQSACLARAYAARLDTTADAAEGAPEAVVRVAPEAAAHAEDVVGGRLLGIWGRGARVWRVSLAEAGSGTHSWLAWLWARRRQRRRRRRC